MTVFGHKYQMILQKKAAVAVRVVIGILSFVIHIWPPKDYATEPIDAIINIAYTS
jgi:hypothetical protein